MEREAYYCRCCRCHQLATEGARCKTCDAPTVSWFIDRETAEEVHRKWERSFGGYQQDRGNSPLWERTSQQQQPLDRDRYR